MLLCICIFSIKFLSGGAIRFKRFTFSCKKPKMYFFSFSMDSCPPRQATRRWAARYSFVAASVVRSFACILKLLNPQCRSKVAKSVVGPVSVDVVNLMVWPFPRLNRPGNVVGVISDGTDADYMVSGSSMNRTSRRSGLPWSFNIISLFPHKFPCVGIVIENASEVICGFHPLVLPLQAGPVNV